MLCTCSRGGGGGGGGGGKGGGTGGYIATSRDLGQVL